MSVLVVPSALLLLGSDDAAATTAPGSTASGTTAGSLVPLAWGSLALSFLVVVAALLFMYMYHRGLLAVVSEWVKRGGALSAISEPVRDSGTVAAQVAGFAITSDAIDGHVQPGQDVKFQADGLDAAEAEKVVWVTEKGSPPNGSGASFSSRAPASGEFTVTAAIDGQESAELTLTVAGPADKIVGSDPGVVLPFTVRGWGGLVITILGIGVVAALMFAEVVSAEGGLGILGVLFGVGAASALSSSKTADEAPTADKLPKKPD